MVSTVFYFLRKRHQLNKKDFKNLYFGISGIAALPVFVNSGFGLLELARFFSNFTTAFHTVIIASIIGLVIIPYISLKGVYGHFLGGLFKMKDEVSSFKFDNDKELKLVVSQGLGMIGVLLTVITLILGYLLNSIVDVFATNNQMVLGYVFSWFLTMTGVTLALGVYESFSSFGEGEYVDDPDKI